MRRLPNVTESEYQLTHTRNSTSWAVSVWDAWAKERNSVPLGKRENDDFIVVPEAHLLFTIWDFELCFW